MPNTSDYGPTNGAQGPQGYQGFQGYQGNFGAQGYQGTNPGPQGNQGFQGNTGPQGYQGSTGPQGYQGSTGPQGNQGFQGNTGPQGYQGFQGVQGFQGNQGWQGDESSGGWSTVNDVTTNQSPTTSDAGELYRYVLSTAANKTLTLPSVGAGDDGIVFWIGNESSWEITVTPSDSDSVWSNGAGYGVVIGPKTYIAVKYYHAGLKWKVINKAGGRVSLEGLKLNLMMDTIDGSSYLSDGAKRHVAVVDTCSVSAAEYKFKPASLSFADAASEVVIADHADWNFFSSQATDITMEFFVYFNDATGIDWLCSYWEDSDNRWSMVRPTGATTIAFTYESGATTYISLNAGTCNASTWYHIVFAKIGEETGLYIDGTQVDYDATFTTDTLVSTMKIGSVGTDTGNMDGYIDAFTIIYSNYYNLAPNSTPDDTIAGWNTETRIIPYM